MANIDDEDEFDDDDEELELPELPNMEAVFAFFTTALAIMADELEDVRMEMDVLKKHGQRPDPEEVGEIISKLEAQSDQLHRMSMRELGRVQGVLPPASHN